jgi:hypothetical protein
MLIVRLEFIHFLHSFDARGTVKSCSYSRACFALTQLWLSPALRLAGSALLVSRYLLVVAVMWRTGCSCELESACLFLG